MSSINRDIGRRTSELDQDAAVGEVRKSWRVNRVAEALDMDQSQRAGSGNLRSGISGVSA